jgi:hypothetical protein
MAMMVRRKISCEQVRATRSRITGITRLATMTISVTISAATPRRRASSSAEPRPCASSGMISTSPTMARS